MPSYGGVIVELRPHRQRETVPIGLVELSPYRVNLTSVGWRRTAHIDRRERIQLMGVLTDSVSSTRRSPRFMVSTMPTAYVGRILVADLGGLPNLPTSSTKRMCCPPGIQSAAYCWLISWPLGPAICFTSLIGLRVN